MTTLIAGPIVALTLMSATEPVASHSARSAAHPVATVRPRVLTAAVPDIVDRQALTPVTAPPVAPAAPVAPPVAAPVRPRATVAPRPVTTGPPADPNSIIGIIEAAAARWGVSGDWMVKIARCESGLRPNAYNPRGPYIGLFQFLQSTFTHNGGTNIYDAADQANITAKMLAHGQAHQWSCA